MTLLITKQTGNYFSFVLNGDVANRVSNDQNRLLTQGSFCNFKTGNGSNIIKEQNISFSDITLVASGTFTFASVDLLWIKLIEVGFFDGLGNGGGTGGVDRFDELLDTFSYFGHSNEAVVVNASETGLTSIDLYNYSKFVELSDTPSTLVPNKMVVVNAAGTSLILIDQPQQSEQFLNSVGYFNYADSGNLVSFVANTEKKLNNDISGARTDLSQSPFGISTIWNTDSNRFDFSQMDVGDTVDIRIDLDLDNTLDEVGLRIGADESYDLPLFNSVSGIGLASYITQVPITSDAKIYGAEVYVRSSINGTLTVIGFYTRILRKNINIVNIEGGSDLSVVLTSYDVTVESSTGNDAVIPSATNTYAGVMSATDKVVLDSIPDPALKQDKLNGTGLVRGDGGIITYDQNNYLTANDLPSTLTLYPTSATSNVSGYLKLVTAIDSPDFDSVPVDFSTGVISSIEQLLGSLISLPNLINGDPGVFNVTTVGNIRKISGSGNAEFFFRIFKRDVNGSEILVGTSGVTLPVTNGGYSEFRATALFDDGIFVETDRIVIKLYANKIEGGSNPVYEFQFGGNSPIRTVVPIPTSVIPNIFLGDLSDVENGTPLDKEILSFNGTSEIWEYQTIDTVLGYTPENSAEKGVPNGYASLDEGGLVPSFQLPSYVDDILEFADLASFPISGESGKIYIAISPDNLQYRWAGTGYIQITNGLIATTNDLPEGGFNLYFTVARVLNTILTNLSTASNSVITATDTVLSALGKLQAQINGKAPSSGSANYIQNGTNQQTANLNISGNGTFGSSVKATSIGVGVEPTIGKLEIRGDGTRNGGFTLFNGSGFSAKIYIDNAQDNLTFSRGNADYFSISNLGAATFSSSVTADGTIIPKSNVFFAKDGGSLIASINTAQTAFAPLNFDSTAYNFARGAATFASSVTVGTTDSTSIINAGGTNTNLTLKAAGANGSIIFMAGGVANGTISTREVLNLNGTSGAATFASSVTANNDLIVSKSTGNPTLIVKNTATSSFPLIQLQDNRTSGGSWNIENGRNGQNLEFFASDVGTLFSLNRSGAATFSSSVTANEIRLLGSGLDGAANEVISLGRTSSTLKNRITSTLSSAGVLNIVKIQTSTGVADVYNDNLVLRGDKVGINNGSPTTTLDVNGTFNTTGAATFASSVTANSLTARNGNNGVLNLGSATFFTKIEQDATVTGATIYTNSANSGAGHIFKVGTLTVLEITNIGAATFASSVTANQDFIRKTSGTSESKFSFEADASNWGVARSNIGFTVNDNIDGSTDFRVNLWRGTPGNGYGGTRTKLLITSDGAATFASLAGTGTRSVVALPNGTLAAEDSQITITTTASITTNTLDSSGRGQKDKNVIIDNGVNAINITVNGGTNFIASYLKHGTGAITFVQGSGRTLVQVDATAVFNGLVGSTAAISSVGTTDYLRISNAS